MRNATVATGLQLLQLLEAARRCSVQPHNRPIMRLVAPCFFFMGASVQAGPAAPTAGLVVSAIVGDGRSHGHDRSTQMAMEFADHGSGAKKDLSIWGMSSATAAAGWKVAGHAAEAGYGAPSAGLLVVKVGTDAKALAAPTGLSLNWSWEKNGFYTPVCPGGYAALGSVATGKAAFGPPRRSLSDFPGLMCVSEKYLTKAPVKLREVWTDSKHVGKQDGSAWSQPPFDSHRRHPGIAMPFVAGSPSSDSAPTWPSYTINSAKVQIVVLPVPPPPPPPPPAALVPEQVHLALGFSVDTMAVSWSTVSSQTSSAQVMYGSSATALTKTSTGDSRIFTADPGRTWHT